MFKKSILLFSIAAMLMLATSANAGRIAWSGSNTDEASSELLGSTALSNAVDGTGLDAAKTLHSDNWDDAWISVGGGGGGSGNPSMSGTTGPAWVQFTFADT